MEAGQLHFDNDVFRTGRQTFRAINHKLSQKMIEFIHRNGKMMVTDIYIKMRLEQSVVSQHLAILRGEKFLNTERVEKRVYYSVNYERMKEVQEIVRRLTEQQA